MNIFYSFVLSSFSVFRVFRGQNKHLANFSQLNTHNANTNLLRLLSLNQSLLFKRLQRRFAMNLIVRVN